MTIFIKGKYKRKRITHDMDADLHQELKKLAKKNNISLTYLINDILAQSLKIVEMENKD